MVDLASSQLTGRACQLGDPLAPAQRNAKRPNTLIKACQALLCIAHDPGVRLRDIATTLMITERRAYGIVGDLTRAGHLVKARDGRRNRYQVQGHLLLPDPIPRSTTVGEVLALLVGDSGAVVPVARPAARDLTRADG